MQLPMLPTALILSLFSLNSSYLIFTSLILSILLNLSFLISTVYPLILFFISSPEIMIFIITIPEQLQIIAHILFCRTNIKQFTILFQGPKVWNSLLTAITSSESLLSFRKKMLTFLINQYN